MLLVVLAVILFVALNNFKSVAPAALEVQKHNKARKNGQDVRPEDREPNGGSRSASADTWTPAPPSRPNLDTMDQKTTEHTAAVQDALSHDN